MGDYGVHCKTGTKIQVLMFSYLYVVGGGTGRLSFQAIHGSE